MASSNDTTENSRPPLPISISVRNLFPPLAVLATDTIHQQQQTVHMRIKAIARRRSNNFTCVKSNCYHRKYHLRQWRIDVNWCRARYCFGCAWILLQQRCWTRTIMKMRRTIPPLMTRCCFTLLNYCIARCIHAGSI